MARDTRNAWGCAATAEPADRRRCPAHGEEARASRAQLAVKALQHKHAGPAFSCGL